MRTGRIIAVIVGAVLAVIGFGALVGGGAMVVMQSWPGRLPATRTRVDSPCGRTRWTPPARSAEPHRLPV